MYKNTLYLIFLISLISCSSSGEDINYPESKKIGFKENLHGYEITDDYRWLEDFTSDESIDWIKTVSYTHLRAHETREDRGGRGGR